MRKYVLYSLEQKLSLHKKVEKYMKGIYWRTLTFKKSVIYLTKVNYTPYNYTPCNNTWTCILSLTCSCRLIRYFGTLFWNDMALVYWENFIFVKTNYKHPTKIQAYYTYLIESKLFLYLEIQLFCFF